MNAQAITPPAYSQGFTTIELMVAIAVLAIMIALAAPSFSDFTANQRVKTATFDLFSSLVYARSEAIKRNASVSVTPASGGWQNGWTVATGTTTLNQQAALSGLTFTTAPAGNVTFNGNGRLAAAVNAFEITSSTASVTPRCIRIDLGGKPNSKTGGCS